MVLVVIQMEGGYLSKVKVWSGGTLGENQILVVTSGLWLLESSKSCPLSGNYLDWGDLVDDYNYDNCSVL